VRSGGMEQGPSKRTLVTYFGIVTVFLLIFLWIMISKLFLSVPIDRQFVMATCIALVGNGYYFRTTNRAYFKKAIRLRLYTLVVVGAAAIDFLLSFST
jgi:hypothetical protein